MSTKKERTSEKLVKRDIEALRENDEQLASMKEEVSTKKEKCCEQMTCDCLPFSHLQSESIEWDEETFEDLWWGSFDNDGEKNSHEYDKMLSYVKDAITTSVAKRELEIAEDVEKLEAMKNDNQYLIDIKKVISIIKN